MKWEGTAATRRRARSSVRKRAESRKMREVRERDEFCRFPLCGCLFKDFPLEVSHQKHRGMGGNPKLDRSDPALMLLVCRPRHRLNIFSIDRKTLKWEALTDAGSRGPIRWLVSTAALRRFFYEWPWDGEWIVLATETAPHVLMPLTPLQETVLARLAPMTW